MSINIKIYFSDDNIINIQVPVGWFWIDVADALFEAGEITQDQVELIYGHQDSEEEAFGTLQFESNPGRPIEKTIRLPKAKTQAVVTQPEPESIIDAEIVKPQAEDSNSTERLHELMMMLKQYNIGIDTWITNTSTLNPNYNNKDEQLIESLLKWDDDWKGPSEGEEFISAAINFLSEHITLPEELHDKYIGNNRSSTEVEIELEIEASIPEPTEIEDPWIPPATEIQPVQHSFVAQKTYEMQVICSGNKREWVATLISDSKPIKTSTSSGKESAKVSNNQRIHLILDDSGSMRKFSGFKNRAIDQLKEGVISFLHIVRNAQVGIRWFNSPGVPISQVSMWHHDCINNGQAKGGNDHNQSLMDLEEGHYPNQASPGDIVIMFTDGKPNGKGLNVIKAAKLVKARGARIITIGCGDSEPEFMRKIATSHEDHHQVDDISQLTDIFANVGRSLAQRNVSKTDMASSDAKAPARQIQTREHVANAATSSYAASTQLGTDEGFDYVEDFSCHYCKNDMRIICANCSTTHCGGGMKKIGRQKLGAGQFIPLATSGGDNQQSQEIVCPKCNQQTMIEMVDSVLGSASAGGMKKGN